MQDSSQNQLPIKPEQIIDILSRRYLLILIPLCISLTVGLFHTLTTNKTYQASTMILVQPQRVPTNYVRSVVTSTISQRINTISQQILSRSNLEKIIDQFGLYEDSEGMYLEDKITSMRKRIKVNLNRRRQGAEAFSISFKGSDPQRVMRVANTLASYFMDENLKVREAQAVGTSEFLDSELDKTRKRLEEREKQLADYRKKHLGGLPDELESNLRTLDRLQTQLSSEKELLNQTKDSLNTIKNQIARAIELRSSPRDKDLASIGLTDGTEKKSDDEKKLENAKRSYETLSLSYTQKHPDVLKLKKVIEKLESAIAQSQTDLPEQEDKAATSHSDRKIDITLMQLKNQLNLKKQEIKKVKESIANNQKQMNIYQKRVEDTPKRELELQSMQRDYTNIQGVFNSLLNRKLEAELSVNMEKKQKGEQFRILDHARLPEKPISPNVRFLTILSFASGLGFGIAAMFLLEFMDASIRREDQIDELGLKILAIIPAIEKPKDQLKKRVKTVSGICLVVYSILFGVFFAVLNAKGLDRTVALIKSTLNL